MVDANDEYNTMNTLLPEACPGKTGFFCGSKTRFLGVRWGFSKSSYRWLIRSRATDDGQYDTVCNNRYRIQGGGLECETCRLKTDIKNGAQGSLNQKARTLTVHKMIPHARKPW
jgi:hypothetical protein